MEELRKENELLLKLVRTLQSQISSKTRQNQLLFQQYEQLANENKVQAADILTCRTENRQLRRASFTKDTPKYTYAVLNSPRTERLMADLQQTQVQLTAANQRIEVLTGECEALRTGLNKRERPPEAQGSGTLAKAPSSGRIEDLQRNLLRKEKELRELTLIMYAKDASTSEIAIRQQEKNREIEGMRRQISVLKQQRDDKYSQMMAKEEKSAVQVAEMQKQVAQLSQKMQVKNEEVVELQSVIARKAETLEQLSQFMNEQAEQLQNALQIIHSLQQGQTAITNAQELLQSINGTIKQRQQFLQGLRQRLQQLEVRLQEKENSHALTLEVIRHSQAQIASYQQIKDHLTAQIQHYTRQSMLCKQDLAREIQQSEQEHLRQSVNLQSLQHQIQEQKHTLQRLIKQGEDAAAALDRAAGQVQCEISLELAEKEESIAAFMDVMESLQAQIKTKDSQIEDLMAQKQQFLLKTNQLQAEFIQIEAITMQSASLRAQLSDLTKQLIKIKAQNSELQKNTSIIDDLRQQTTRLAKQLKEKTLRQGGSKEEQYIDMLNAVIDSIKNEHEESITKLHTKNHIIAELQKRLEDAEQNYHAEITNLRNSIACQEVISYEQLVKAAEKRPKPSPKDIQQEQFDELLEEIDALRGELQRKDRQLQQMRSQLDVQAEEESVSRAMEDNNSRPISNIKPLLDSPHVYELQQDSPSHIQLENSSLHETIQEQSYTILELQDSLMRTENTHSAEVVTLRKNIAELTAEVLMLKRTLYELNPKAMDLTAFISVPNGKRDHPSIIAKQSLKRTTSPLTPTTAYSHQNRKPPYQQESRKPPIPLPIPIPSAPRSNPYIAMMTNEKGELRMPEGGCWSIQQLRDLIQ